MQALEVVIQTVFGRYWKDRDAASKADVLLPQVGQFFKECGKKIAKANNFLEDCTSGESLLLELAKIEWKMRASLQEALSTGRVIGMKALPEAVQAQPTVNEECTRKPPQD
jgi:hypothetical protein